MKNKITKIVFVTILNNYSGNPHILSIIIKGLLEKNYKVKLITSKTKGFMSDIEGLDYDYIIYKNKGHMLNQIITLLITHIQLFFKILFYKDKNTLFYINTITPVGAIWACKLTKKRMLCHVHEKITKESLLYKIYKYTYKKCSNNVIFVSNYDQKVAPLVTNSKVIYNSLSKEFNNRAKIFLDKNNLIDRNNILFISSLKKYKGIEEFVKIAKLRSKYSFVMILSASPQEVDQFIKEVNPPSNLSIHSVCHDLHPHYQKAKILLQLSHTDECIETFGLTILEAMTYAIPVIGPNQGGPLELIDNNINGFTLNPYEINKVANKIDLLMEREEQYNDFSKKALKKSSNFAENKFIDSIENFITSIKK